MIEIEGIAQSDHLVEKINSLIEVMRQHEGLLNWEFTQPESLLQFLKSTSALRQLSQHAEGFTGGDDLERVTRAATSVFTHLGKQSIDETFNTIKSLKEVDNAIYLQTLAEWIAEKKIKTDELDLSNEEWLELAPHLTFLEYVERADLDPDTFNWLELAPHLTFQEYVEREGLDLDAFIGDLLAKTEKLAELHIVSSQMTGKALEKFTNTDHLVRLTISSSVFTMKNAIRFLMPIYCIDKERGVSLADSLGVIEEQLKFYELFVTRYPDQLDDVCTWVENLSSSEPFLIFRRENHLEISFIKDDLLESDPYQQVLILIIIEHIDDVELRAEALEFLRPFIKTPMDEDLLKFYEKMIAYEKYIGLALEKINLLLTDVNREQKLRCLPYLFGEKIENLKKIFRNIQNLEKTELFDYFTQTFAHALVEHAFRTENLFTEDRNDNFKTIQQIMEYEDVFSTYLNSLREDDFPNALKNNKDLFLTLPGLVFLKTYLHDIVKVPQLQEAALRALPPSNKDNVALYPKKVEFDNGTLRIRVVPTLSVVDAESILWDMARFYVAEGMNHIIINYYGTPVIDASGPGRQLFAEVIQGVVVKKKSHFTSTVGGGMAPYDPTHSIRSRRVIAIFYRDLGIFFSLALHFQYPIGKVLSEKVISCLCSIPTEVLNDQDFDFDVAKFISDMKSGELIQYMKESMTIDEALVKLYEKVLLASSDVEIRQAAQQLNVLLGDDKFQDLINGGIQNISQIQEFVRKVILEEAAFYLYAVYIIAKGMNKRLPSSIGEHAIYGWEDVRSLGAVELSRHLQGELTAQHIRDYLRIRIIGVETPEKVLAAENVKIWTEKWIDEKAENPEILANFVQAFSGGRALTREIRFDIDPHVHNVKVHTCFNSADIPINITETWLLAIFDEFGAGDLRFDME